MVSYHECIECGALVCTESTTGGAFKIPPTLMHVHDDGREYPMDAVTHPSKPSRIASKSGGSE